MLHENAKQRLWRMVPREYDLSWYDHLADDFVEETITLSRASQIRWARQGSSTNYPCIYLKITPMGTPRGDIGHMFEDGVYKEPVPQDDTIAYRKFTAAPQRSRITITVAVKEGTATIPKRVVADDIAIQCWHAFRFDSGHLSYQGVDPTGQTIEDAWPMGIRETSGGMTDTSADVDQLPIERRVFEFDIEYAYFKEEEVEAVDSIVWRFGVDKNYDGEPEDWTDWHQTPGSDAESVIDDVEQYMQDKEDGLHEPADPPDEQW